ncbi:zinc finger protein CONSTANS-LIKE 13 isoform X2 [Quercus robur]|uniref:zinc finger protein CONSTANS-LIKE 13 isoform X2 n=1 Tax=Quercus robur TaxID=38942 RepID=UPI0021624EF5|nr:zinc finger protein CONSTANS-LIKE 13 isoform X2 [Quercus robur]
MTDSRAQIKQQDQNIMSPQIQKRLCDYCSETTALLYCRADSAKLCFLCDREVHSTNQLFSKHTRSRLCDSCDSSPASIFCSTECSVLCQNCDWERHSLSLSQVHNRRPLEGFTGCPSVHELLGIVGFEETGHKALFLKDESTGGDDGFDGLSDFLVWDTPCAVSLDDLISSTSSEHDFQAMEVPPLPKNRNAACGLYKDEIINQLRELVKLEPNLNCENVDAEPLTGFQPLLSEQNVQQEDMVTGFADNAEPFVFPRFEASAFQCCTGGSEAANHFFLPNSSTRSYLEESHVVTDKHSDISCSVTHANDGSEGHSRYPIKSETSSAFQRIASHELNSQERDSALSRYKEKKKTRRYEKHIRYESRKVRAESRIRIKGRFAKMDTTGRQL